MLRHITVANYGSYIRISGERLIVEEKGEKVATLPLSRLKSVSIAKRGVSLSVQALVTCTMRGINFFFLDYRNQIVTAAYGTSQHATAEVRRKQFYFAESERCPDFCAQLIYAKIRNQRAVLLYFSKYLSKKDKEKSTELKISAERLKQSALQLKPIDWLANEQWLYELLGYEGSAAREYWSALVKSGLFPESFKRREKRYSQEITNSALNFAYAILMSRIWHCVINAGLEPYFGFIHQERAGKPSLVLDIMEEYRAWIVDRNIIKMRNELSGATSLTAPLKKKIIQLIEETFERKILLKGKRLKLETIMQRQVYRLGGMFAGNKKYRPYLFKW